MSLVDKINKSKSTMSLRSNGAMMVSHKANVPGYHRHVWLSEKSTTNIVFLKNLGYQYLVTYRSDETMFIVHRETHGNHNMKFRTHENGMHDFDNRDQAFTFVVTSPKT